MTLLELIDLFENKITLTPASDAQIMQAECDLNLKFSDEYKNYLKRYGVAIFDGHELTGLCNGKRLDVIRVTKEQRRLVSHISNEWYVVECLNIDQIVIWQDVSGNVYQTSPVYGCIKIANTLAEYIGK